MTKRFYSARWAALAFMGLMFLFILACSDAKQTDVAGKTKDLTAPDFSVKNVTGQNFKLSSQKGNYVLLIFMATWCPTCRSEIPHYKNIFEAYGKKGLEVAMIDIDESQETVSRFVSKYQIPFTTLLDAQAKVAFSYGIVGVPTMILINKDSRILSRDYMAMDMLLERIFVGK